MSAEHLKSTAITNATATPATLMNAQIGPRGNFLISAKAGVTPAAAAEVGSTYRFVRVPSSAVIRRVGVTAADFTTAGAVDIGLYRTSDDGGAVVDADFFTSALDLSGGPFANSDQTFESGEYTQAKSLLPLWQALGLTSDPDLIYDVVATVTTQFNGGQTMYLTVEYVDF